MKHILLITAVAFTLQSSAQNINLQDSLHKISNHELALQYISKGKQQKKTGNILAISGSACVTAALIIAVAGLSEWNSNSVSRGNGLDDAGTVLTIAGGALVITGIPFKYIARHNIKKGELLLQSNNTLPSTSFIHEKIYSVGIRIDL